MSYEAGGMEDGICKFSGVWWGMYLFALVLLSGKFIREVRIRV